jgi:hypothetical protein
MFDLLSLIASNFLASARAWPIKFAGQNPHNMTVIDSHLPLGINGDKCQIRWID